MSELIRQVLLTPTIDTRSMTQATIELASEIGRRENNPIVWFLLGSACGMIMRALPEAEPSREVLDAVARCALMPDWLEQADAIIADWIEVRDQMRRTRLRRGAPIQ